MNSTPRFLAGGELVPFDSSETIDVVNPATEETIGKIGDANKRDVDRAVSAARDAFENSGWARMSPQERAVYVAALAKAFDKYGESISSQITDQNGITLGLSRKVNYERPQSIYALFAGFADDISSEEIRSNYNRTSQTLLRYEPYGVTGFILPWNGPQLLLAFKLAPSLMAGNTVVFKAAPETSLDLATFNDAINEAGFPAGVINFITGGREAGDALVRHPDVSKVGFTGSTEAGRKIGAACGEALKPVTLELGGKSAAIVLEDADLDLLVRHIPETLIPGNGQACNANTRILVPRAMEDTIVERLAEGMRKIVVGDPRDERSVYGPLAAERQRERVERYIALGIKEGADIVVGGGRPANLNRGYYVEPTLFRNVTNDMTIAREEIFGPVLSVIAYDSEAEAIAISNDSSFGLGGIVYTADHGRAVDIARQIQTGSIGINRYAVDYNTPFGGYKASGVGRDLGLEAVNAYRQSKAIYI